MPSPKPYTLIDGPLKGHRTWSPSIRDGLFIVGEHVPEGPSPQHEYRVSNPANREAVYVRTLGNREPGLGPRAG
jgi:hypothetical protein